MEFEPVIGLEVHVQLSTNSKIFTPSSAEFGGEPNEFIDPVTLGLPGALPVLNKAVVEYAVMMGIATRCQIRNFNRFARKHYFYPDLPKGYQISQFDEPICEHGEVHILIDKSTRSIGITRIHMEEDAGKNIHDIRTNSSLVDLNRAGVPLLEIVSAPDLRSAQEASEFLKTIRQLVRYLGISDGNMEQGSLRCDANISLRPKGSLTFGTRAEVKNLNSFKFVEKAIEYEIARQAALLNNCEKVVQETRLFDSTNGTTRSMRGKEESADYRYMPDPDLPPLMVEESWIERIKGKMPKLPEEWLNELVNIHSLSAYDAQVLIADRESVEYFDRVFSASGNAKASANWVTSELFGMLNRDGKSVEESPVSPENLGSLIKLIDNETISGKMAKSVFEEMYLSGKSPETIVEERGLKQESREEVILPVVQSVIEEQQDQLSKYLAGNERLLGFFIGQTMKKLSNANPKIVNDLVVSELNKRKG